MANIVLFIFLGLPFAAIAFKFNDLKTTRLTFSLIAIFCIVLAAATQNSIVMWIPLAVLSAAVATRCNALHTSSTWRWIFTFLPMLTLLAVPYYAIKGKASIDKIFLYAADGNIEKLRERIVKGDNVDSIDYRGATPLFYAARNGQLAAIDLLLKNGASTTISLSGGSTAEDIAAQHGHRNVAERIRQHQLLRAGKNEPIVQTII